MKRILLILLYLFISQTNCFSQTIQYGTKSYVEYRVGTLPIVISVPHGGYKFPTLIPDRTCKDPITLESPVTVTDAYTIETAEKISAALFAATGCYPHIIICNLNRIKLDCNRTLAEGACGDPQSEKAWNEYHDFVTTALNTANLQYNNKTLLVDLHGHGHAIQRIELGYLLSGTELRYTDTKLNSSTYINQSSIKNLALNNSNNFNLTELLRGPKSMGTLLTIENYPAVPSQQNPYPLSGESYFSGGYTTESHTCFDPAILNNGFQMELNYDVRSTNTNRTNFAEKFKNVVIEFLTTHTNVVIGGCATLGIESHTDSELIIYPNPLKSGSQLFLQGLKGNNLNYRIINNLGQEIARGNVSNDNAIEIKNNLAKGVYFVSISSLDGLETKKIKLLID